MLDLELTAEQATLLFQQGQEEVVFVPLNLASRLAENQAIASKPDPSATSGQSPPIRQG
jgi:hypothetical protein